MSIFSFFKGKSSKKEEENSQTPETTQETITEQSVTPIVQQVPQTVADITSIYDIKINGIDGKPIDLHQFKGKKMMFVNVASQCGFTNQYKGLQELHEAYNNKLAIIGLPCNQFGGQEPGTESEIQDFCKTNFGVSFPLTQKIEVKGENQHLLYKWLTQESVNGVKDSTIKWNFQKYLIDENGNYMRYWYSLTKPMSDKITNVIEQA